MADLSAIKVEPSQKLNVNLPETIKSEEKFASDLCDKEFSPDSNLSTEKVEQSILATEKAVQKAKKIFKCDLCSKEFYIKKYLTKHMAKHTGEKKFVCNVCGKDCFRKTILIQHMTTHTVEEEVKIEEVEPIYLIEEEVKVEVEPIYLIKEEVKIEEVQSSTEVGDPFSESGTDPLKVDLNLASTTTLESLSIKKEVQVTTGSQVNDKSNMSDPWNTDQNVESKVNILEPFITIKEEVDYE